MKTIILYATVALVFTLVVDNSEGFLLKKSMKKEMKMAKKGMKKGGYYHPGMPARHMKHVSHASFHMPDFHHGGEVEIHEMDMSHGADFMNMIQRHEMMQRPPMMLPPMMPPMMPMGPMAAMMQQMMMMNMMKQMMEKKAQTEREQEQQQTAPPAMPPSMQNPMMMMMPMMPMSSERLVTNMPAPMAMNMAPSNQHMMAMVVPNSGMAHRPVPAPDSRMADSNQRLTMMGSQRVETKVTSSDRLEQLKSSSSGLTNTSSGAILAEAVDKHQSEDFAKTAAAVVEENAAVHS